MEQLTSELQSMHVSATRREEEMCCYQEKVRVLEKEGVELKVASVSFAADLQDPQKIEATLWSMGVYDTLQHELMSPKLGLGDETYWRDAPGGGCELSPKGPRGRVGHC